MSNDLDACLWSKNFPSSLLLYKLFSKTTAFLIFTKPFAMVMVMVYTTAAVLASQAEAIVDR